MSIYTEDEPYASMLTGATRREQHGNCLIDITATGETGINTGRRRFRVHCSTCGVLVHPATTGPDQLAEVHLRDVERGRVVPWPE